MTCFARSNIEIVNSNPTPRMELRVFLRLLFPVYVAALRRADPRTRCPAKCL